MIEISEVDVVVLDRKSGEVTFRTDGNLNADDVVTIRGVAFSVTDPSITDESTQPPTLIAKATVAHVDYPDLDVEPFAMTLGPDDIVVIQSLEQISQQRAQRIHDSISQQFPGRKVLVLDGSLRIGKLTP